MAGQQDAFYLRDIEAVAVRRPIWVERAIEAHGGALICQPGLRVDGEVIDRLVGQRLTVPIDRCLTIGDPVTLMQILTQSRGWIERVPLLHAMYARLQDPSVLRDSVLGIPFNPSLAFRLTILSEQRPRLYDHSLRVMLIALWLGAMSRLPRADLRLIAAAGLVHDLGEMHFDPALFNIERVYSDDERRRLTTHTMISQLLVSDYPGYQPEISTAVREHHERLDGSGYPGGAALTKISPFGRILALAEAVDGLFSSRGFDGVRTAIRLGGSQFDSALVRHLVALLAEVNVEGASHCDVDQLAEQLKGLFGLFSTWDRAHATHQRTVEPAAETSLISRLDGKLNGLILQLHDAGLGLQSVDALLADLADAPDALRELAAVAREALWQIKNVLRSLKLNRSLDANTGDEVPEWVRQWIEQAEQVITIDVATGGRTESGNDGQ